MEWEERVNTKNKKFFAPAGLYPFSAASFQLNHVAKTFKGPVKGLVSRCLSHHSCAPNSLKSGRLWALALISSLFFLVLIFHHCLGMR